MNIIEIRDHVFLLNTLHTSYLFKVNEHNHLEHIHYGCKALLEDQDALSVKHWTGYGTTIMYDEKDQTYSLDHIPLEYGTYGKGDLREASVEVECKDSYTLDLTYDSYEIIDGDTVIEGLPNAYSCDKTLLVHMKDIHNGICLDLYYGIYYDTDVISRRCVLINRSGSTIVLHKLLSYCLDLSENDLTLMSFTGAWNKEAHLTETDLERGKQVIESRSGFSGNKTNPGFIVRKDNATECNGKAWGFNLIYSGNHYSSVAKDEYGVLRIQGGINPERFELKLKNKESFSSPEAVLTYTDQGLNDLSAHFHDFVNEHIVRSDWKKKERPILINSWEAFGMKFTKDSLLKLAQNAKDMGIEMFVLDDGWFGRRDSDLRGLGDYNCNRKKIPGGIKSLSKSIHDMGMLFGIWVEPEAINPNSALYEKHPEYALNENERGLLLGRHELLMDLSSQEVRDYIVENVTKLIDENDVDYIKWDMNRLMSSLSGAANHEYIKGLYEVLDRIFIQRPWVLLESCSSGGNRFDLGMLCYSPQIWASDDTDPIERLDIQKGLSYLYPVSTMGAHVSASPHSMTFRSTPLETRFHVAAFGAFGYELDLGSISSLSKKEIKEQVSYYKQHRSTFQFGRFYRIDEESDYEVFEVQNEEETIVAKFRRMVHAVPYFDKLNAYGLKEDKVYTIDAREFSHNIKKFGNLLNYVVPVRLNAEGLLVHSVSKRRGFKEGTQNYRASGRALRYGINLNNLFLGSGFDKHLRLSLDYGSDMFLIKEVNNESGKEE